MKPLDILMQKQTHTSQNSTIQKIQAKKLVQKDTSNNPYKSRNNNTHEA